MKPLFGTRIGTTACGAFCVIGLALALTTAPAMAKGCIKGAIVGGIAGHVAHHGLLGAAAGCVIGHHEAAKREKERALQNQPPSVAPGPPDPGKYQ